MFCRSMFCVNCAPGGGGGGAVITRPNGCVFPAADDTSAAAAFTLFPAHRSLLWEIRWTQWNSISKILVNYPRSG